MFELYKQVLETGEMQQTEVPLNNRWYHFSMARFGEGIIVSTQDITPMHKYRHQLEIANYELQRSNESLQSFAFITSHDLQEPLRKITSFADVLHTRHGGQFDAETTDIIRRINGSAERMRLLIQDLLAYSRVETHRETFKPIELTKLIQGLQQEELWVAMHQSKAVINLGELPTLVADPMQMRQLFQDLLSNAIKFCPNGVMPVITISSRIVDKAEVPVGLLSPALAGVYYPQLRGFCN